MRASELRGLRWSDVDLTKREVNVRQRADRYLKIGHPKSASGIRTIPIGDRPLTRCESGGCNVRGGDENLVFPTGAGTIENHSNLVQRILDPAQVAAGVVDNKGKP